MMTAFHVPGKDNEIADFQRQSRVDVESIDFPESMQRNEISTYNRSVRLQNKSPTSAICSLETGPGSGSGELILDEVDERTRVGISALLSRTCLRY